MSAVQIVGIGDSHLRSGHPRNADRLRALDTIIEHGLRLQHLGGWAWLGDVFDARSSIDDRNAVAERLLMMAGRAPVCVVAGNHDLLGDLTIFGKLGTAWPVHVIEAPRVFTLTLATGAPATIFALPHPTEAGLVAQGVAPGDIPAAAKQALDAIFLDAGAKLATARADGDLTLFVGHITVTGAVASTGQPQVNLGMEIDAAMLARLGDCPKLLGHIHKAQEIGGAVYAGSISRNDFGEVEQKRFLVVELEHGSWSVHSHPLDVAPMYLVDAVFADGKFTYAITKGPDGTTPDLPASWRGCDVRVRARFAKSETTFFGMAKATLQAAFADALRLSIEPICVPDRALRAPQVAAARSLREKVTAWAEVTGTVLPALVLELLDRVERSDSELLLAEVQRAIDAVVTPADCEVAA